MDNVGKMFDLVKLLPREILTTFPLTNDLSKIHATTWSNAILSRKALKLDLTSQTQWL